MSYSQDPNNSPAKRGCFTSLTKRLHNDYVEVLDVMESRVENMREKASTVEMERENLIRHLGRIKISKDLKRFTEEEREEIEATAQRLMNRVLTVEVNVITSRNEIQKKSVTKANKLIDDLYLTTKTNETNSKETVERYLNSCRSDSVGPTDNKFQAMVLDCAADDQKRIRKRLESLMEIVNNSIFPMDID